MGWIKSVMFAAYATVFQQTCVYDYIYFCHGATSCIKKYMNI